METAKPIIFIASSVEGLDVAYAVQELLDYVAECTVWDQGIFEPSSNTLNDLIEVSKKSDYGIFVFSFEDIVKIRNSESKSTRDNVIFELGLFIGALGKERSFIVMPRGISDFHIPTDLTGITPITYDSKRKDNNLLAALGPTVYKIKQSLQKYGLKFKRMSDNLIIQISDVGLSAFYSSRDAYAKYRVDAGSIDRYINTASKSIHMISVSLMTGIPFDDICLLIKKRLTEQEDFKVTISLLNPLQNELFSSLAPCFDIDPKSLKEKTKESLSTLYELKNKLSSDAKKRFDIKVHSVIPFGSAIIIDGDFNGGRIQIETKPYKVGVRKSFAYEITNNGNSFYETIKSSYYKLIEDGLVYEDIRPSIL